MSGNNPFPIIALLKPPLLFTHDHIIQRVDAYEYKKRTGTLAQDNLSFSLVFRLSLVEMMTGILLLRGEIGRGRTVIAGSTLFIRCLTFQ